jgi:hypothetical protein
MALHVRIKTYFLPVFTFTPVNEYLRLQCLYNCQEPRDSIHVFMISRGHYPSCRGVNYQRSIFSHALGQVLIAAVVATN